jgi:hypothetical protein
MKVRFLAENVPGWRSTMLHLRSENAILYTIYLYPRHWTGGNPARTMTTRRNAAMGIAPTIALQTNISASFKFSWNTSVGDMMIFLDAAGVDTAEFKGALEAMGWIKDGEYV